ncbi:MAG: UDP-N-acetylglucosamine 2-epimerase, partial [Victivallales bacterium]|nr:UDP-N-acetylglucosamine 2-epimerase [Victivallales bacterium]
MAATGVKRILFLTGTRADFGKQKSLMRVVRDTPGFECRIFATGMHMLERYGSTYLEIGKCGFESVFVHFNQMRNTSSDMDIVLANTITGLGHYIREFRPDMIVVHGDRVETLAGAIVGALNNILVAHIEGGEISGTVDELLRHSVSKLAHIHFVANAEARRRLIQMGEEPDHIFVIGSPDIDLVLGDQLPELDAARRYYDIPFERYGIFCYHPVTTEVGRLQHE